MAQRSFYQGFTPACPDVIQTSTAPIYTGESARLKLCIHFLYRHGHLDVAFPHFHTNFNPFNHLIESYSFNTDWVIQHQSFVVVIISIININTEVRNSIIKEYTMLPNH